VARLTTRSQGLQRTIRLATGPLAGASERFVSHPRAAEIYPKYLVSMLAVMRGILAVMGAARDRARLLAQEDAVAAGIVQYLEKHLDEELGHDAWVVDDLHALGLHDATDATTPSVAIARLIGCQYYWTYHAHPVAVLGYLLVAEGEPTSPATVERLREATGLPTAAFRTLLEHAELDGSHGTELAALLDELPLTEAHERLLAVSAATTAALMAEALDEVISSVR